MSYNFKKIMDLELVNEVPEGANVLIETDGATKRLPSTAIKSDDSYTKEEVYTKEECDAKYLTEHVQVDFNEEDTSVKSHILNRPFYSIETITWDGVIGNRTQLEAYVHVSDRVLTVEELATSYTTAVFQGNVMSIPCNSENVKVNDNGLINAQSCMVIPTDDFDIAGDGSLLLPKGTYFLCFEEGVAHVSSLELVKRLDIKFVPEIDYQLLVNKPTIPSNVVQYTTQTLDDSYKAQARTNIGAAAAADVYTRTEVDAKISDTAVILASSTEGSTKKFNITVDDTGAITATEIV